MEQVNRDAPAVEVTALNEQAPNPYFTKRKRNEREESVERHKRACIAGTNSIQDLETVAVQPRSTIYNPLKVGNIIPDSVSVFMACTVRRFKLDSWSRKARLGMGGTKLWKNKENRG